MVVRGVRQAARRLCEYPAGFGQGRDASQHSGHPGGQGRGRGVTHSADHRHRPQRGDANGDLRRRAEVRKNRRHNRPVLCDQHELFGYQGRRRQQILLLQRGGLVRVRQPVWPVGRVRVRPARNLHHSSELSDLQCQIRLHLRFHARGRVRRLHPGLHRHVYLRRHGRLRDRLHLSAMVRRQVLSPAGDIRLRGCL